MNEAVFFCFAQRPEWTRGSGAPYAGFLDVPSAADLASTMQLVGHTDGTDVWYTDEAGAPVLLYMSRCVTNTAKGPRCVCGRNGFDDAEALIADLRAYALPGTYVVEGNDVWATPRALRYAAARTPAPGCPALAQHC